MLNISTQDQKLLYKQSSLKKLENNLYLTDTENENYKYIKKKFFYEDSEKAKLLNIWSGIFGTIADIFAYYVGTPDYDFGNDIDDLVRDIISLWFCTIGIERVNWKLQMTYQPAKNYRNENWIDKISRLYQDDKENLYVLITEYYVWRIENKLYAMPWVSLQWWKQVPLDTIYQTANLQEAIETWLDVPALLVVEDSSVSMIERIKPLVYAIDRQIVMNHAQYLQNVESFILFKNIKRPQKLLDQYNAWKRIDFSEVWRIVNGWEDSQVEFVNNVNSLIDKSIEDTDNHIRRISSMTTVPIEFLGLDTNDGSIGVWSRTLKHGAFMKKVEYIRDILDEAFMEFMRLDNNNDTYTRPDVFAKSDKELVEELQMARTANIISQYNAIKKYGNYTDEEAKAEYDIIKWEQQSNALPVTNDTNV